MNNSELTAFKSYMAEKYPNLAEVISKLGPGACAASFVMLVERVLFLEASTPKILENARKAKGKMFDQFELSSAEREKAEFYYVNSKPAIEMREFILETDLTGLAKNRLEKN